MSVRKSMLLVITVSILVMIFAVSASAAAAKKPAAAAAPAVGNESIGIVDKIEIFNSHPDLAKVRQQLSELARRKENEARAAADKETDSAKKAEAVQAKRLELEQEGDKLMAPIYRDCEQAVREVAAKKKLTLVLDKLVVLIGGTDITQDVIQQLSRKK